MKLSKLPAKFEFKTAAVGKSLHDWDAILAVGPGVKIDFEEGEIPTASTFAMMARDRAAQRGLKVLINKTETGLAIRAIEPEDEDEKEEILAKYAAKREREKASSKARKAKKAETNGDAPESDEAE